MNILLIFRLSFRVFHIYSLRDLIKIYKKSKIIQLNFFCYQNTLPFGIPYPLVKPLGLDGHTNSKSGSFLRHLSISTALKKATDYF